MPRASSLALLLALPPLGCTWSSAPSEVECVHPPPPPGPVRVEGGRFVAGGRPFVPRGVGSYPLLEHAGNGRMDAVEDIFEQARALGRPVLRTNAYLDGGRSAARLRDDDGALREEGLLGLDRLLAAASAHDVRLILSLTNNWPDYGGAEAVLRMVAPGEALPKDAFWSDPRAVAAQRAYLTALATRTSAVDGIAYGEHEAVFAWELANEARCTTEARCDADTLVDWARAMSDALRSAGATQPIAWGGSGHVGRYGEDLERLARSGAVDVLTVHVYPFARHALQSSGGSRVGLATEIARSVLRDRAALARRHGLPLLLEEVGWKPSATGRDGDVERALLYRDWLRIARELEVGALPWMIGETGRPDYDGLLVRPDDVATWRVLACE